MPRNRYPIKGQVEKESIAACLRDVKKGQISRKKPYNPTDLITVLKLKSSPNGVPRLPGLKKVLLRPRLHELIMVPFLALILKNLLHSDRNRS